MHPRPEDVLLLIEVADTSVETDRRITLPLYAKAGVREVWLLDLVAERLAVYREPAADGDEEVRTLARGQFLTRPAIEAGRRRLTWPP